MRRRPALAAILAAACIGTLLAAVARAAPAGNWTLDPDGFGPLRIGMSFAQAQALAPGLAATPPGLRASPNCDQLPLPGHAGVALMFVDGVLGRVDIFRPGVRTTRGIAPGDPVASFEHAYPGATRAPNDYAHSEAYLTAGPPHGRALRAETEHGHIVLIYAGNWTQVQYVEGCL